MARALPSAISRARSSIPSSTCTACGRRQSALPDDVAYAKVELLQRHYPSQRGRPWYDREAFLGLARLRGRHAARRGALKQHLKAVDELIAAAERRRKTPAG